MEEVPGIRTKPSLRCRDASWALCVCQFMTERHLGDPRGDSNVLDCQSQMGHNVLRMDDHLPSEPMSMEEVPDADGNEPQAHLQRYIRQTARQLANFANSKQGEDALTLGAMVIDGPEYHSEKNIPAQISNQKCLFLSIKTCQRCRP